MKRVRALLQEFGVDTIRDIEIGVGTRGQFAGKYPDVEELQRYASDPAYVAVVDGDSQWISPAEYELLRDAGAPIARLAEGSSRLRRVTLDS